MLVSKSGMRYLVNIKTSQRKSFKKRNKKSSSQLLDTEDSYMRPDEIVLKFKHSKIEPN